MKHTHIFPQASGRNYQGSNFSDKGRETGADMFCQCRGVLLREYIARSRAP